LLQPNNQEEECFLGYIEELYQAWLPHQGRILQSLQIKDSEKEVPKPVNTMFTEKEPKEEAKGK